MLSLVLILMLVASFTAVIRAPGAGVVTVEYKVTLLSPALGERFVARGRVTRAGRTVTVCTGDVFAVTATDEKPVVTMLATMMSVGTDREAPPLARTRSVTEPRAATDGGAGRGRRRSGACAEAVDSRACCGTLGVVTIVHTVTVIAAVPPHLGQR